MFNDIERFVNWVRRRNPTAYTWKSHTYNLNQFAEIIGDKQPDEITLFDIDAYITELADRGLKPNTINRRIASVTSFYRFLAQEQPGLEIPGPSSSPYASGSQKNSQTGPHGRRRAAV